MRAVLQDNQIILEAHQVCFLSYSDSRATPPRQFARKTLVEAQVDQKRRFPEVRRHPRQEPPEI